MYYLLIIQGRLVYNSVADEQINNQIYCLSKECKFIVLDKKSIPREVDYRSFEPGRRLVIRLPLSIIRKVTFVAISLAIYLSISATIADLLAMKYGIDVVVPPIKLKHLLLFVSLSLCILANIKGSVLTVRLDKKGYRITTPISIRPSKRNPVFIIKHSESSVERKTELLFLGHRVAIRNFERIDKDAEHPFQKFVDAINQNSNTDGYEIPVSNEPSSFVSKLGVSRKFARNQILTRKLKSPPLIILIHGTFGRKSIWARPRKSDFVEKLDKHFNSSQKLIIERFGWSGKNKFAARNEAVNRLIKFLENKLENQERHIFIIAHSYGGDIAVRAQESLPENHRAKVHCMMMNTPFLSLRYRFTMHNIYRELPTFLIRNLSLICFIGFYTLYIAILDLMGLDVLCYTNCDASEVFTLNLWNLGGFNHLFDWWSGLDAWLQNLLVLAAPLLVVVPLWLKLVNLLDEKRKSQVVDSASGGVYIPRNFVINFAQDEANQWLSILVNFLSLLQQALYSSILWLAKGIVKIRAFDLLWDSVWNIFRIGVLVPIAFLVISIAVLWSFDSSWKFYELSTFKDYIGNMFSEFGPDLRRMVGIVGIVCLFAILLFLISGLFRVILLMCNGVIGLPRNLKDLVDALLGSVSISTNPIGYSQTLVLPGTHLFNHTRIYDEPDAIRLIAEKIDEFITSTHSAGGENETIVPVHRDRKRYNSSAMRQQKTVRRKLKTVHRQHCHRK